MTIAIYTIRMIVALILGISFISTLLMWYDARSYGTRLDLANYVSLVIFIIFAYLLWIIR